MNDIITTWNEFAKMKCLSAPEEIVVNQEMNRLTDIGITKEAIIKGIENYKEALSLPNSMANDHPIGMFLRKYLRESFIDGMYDPKRYSKNGYVKPKQEITTPTYVSPRPDHVLTLEERRAIKERMMKSDVKVNALLGSKDHIVDVNKKVSSLKALGLVGPQIKPLEGTPTSLGEPDTAEGKLPAAFIVAKPVVKPVVKTVLKPQQLEISANEKTTKPSNWAEVIKEDGKTNALFSRNHIADTSKKTANLTALGLKPELKIEPVVISAINHLPDTTKKVESKWPEYIQAVRDLKAERNKK